MDDANCDQRPARFGLRDARSDLAFAHARIIVERHRRHAVVAPHKTDEARDRAGLAGVRRGERLDLRTRIEIFALNAEVPHRPDSHPPSASHETVLGTSPVNGGGKEKVRSSFPPTRAGGGLSPQSGGTEGGGIRSFILP